MFSRFDDNDTSLPDESGSGLGPDSGNLGSENDNNDPFVNLDTSVGSFELQSGNLWLDALAQELGHVGIDARNLVSSKKTEESNESDLASLVLAADDQLNTLHRQTRETRAQNQGSSNLSPEYKHKLEITLEQVFVLSKGLVADVGHEAVKILTELKMLKDQNVLLADQVSNVEGKVDNLVIKASAEPRPDQHQLYLDLVKSLADLKHQVGGLAKLRPLPEQTSYSDLVKSLADLHTKISFEIQALATPCPVHQPIHPDLVKSLSALKSGIDGLVKQASAVPRPPQEQQQLVYV